MNASITRLPPELLAASFDYLPEEEMTLCTMTRRLWRNLINQCKPSLVTAPNTLLIHAAKNGHRCQLKLAKKGGATNFDNTMCLAAGGGYPELMKLLRAWDDARFAQQIAAAAQKNDIDTCIKLSTERKIRLLEMAGKTSYIAYESVINIYKDGFLSRKSLSHKAALKVVARGGHVKCIKLSEKWGVSLPKDKVNHVFLKAAIYGHAETMKLVKGLGPTDFKDVFMGTAMEGHVECLKLLKGWGITEDLNDILVDCADYGSTKCLKLLKEWGATEFDRALERTAMEYRIETMKLMKEWGATNFDKALAGMISGDKESERSSEIGTQKIIEGMKLLKEWGATDFDKALAEAAMAGEIECMNLLKKWGATNFRGAIVAVGAYMMIPLNNRIETNKEYPTDLTNYLTSQEVQAQIKCIKLLKKWKTAAKASKSRGK